MKAVVVSAALSALIGSAAYAQESGRAPQEQNPLGGTEPMLWSQFAKDESTLLPQLNAVLGSLRARTGEDSELVAATVQVRVGLDDSESTEDYCRTMPSPGSRIRTERCFDESPAEKALNEYQFEEEIRFARQESARRELEEANRQAQQEAIRRSMAAGMRR